jgi:hypothetical protein
MRIEVGTKRNSVDKGRLPALDLCLTRIPSPFASPDSPCG